MGREGGRLLGISRLRQGRRKMKPRVGAMKTGKHAKRAAERYSVKAVRKPLVKTARRHSAWDVGGRRQTFPADETVAEPAARAAMDKRNVRGVAIDILQVRGGLAPGSRIYG